MVLLSSFNLILTTFPNPYHHHESDITPKFQRTTFSGTHNARALGCIYYDLHPSSIGGLSDDSCVVNVLVHLPYIERDITEDLYHLPRAVPGSYTKERGGAVVAARLSRRFVPDNLPPSGSPGARCSNMRFGNTMGCDVVFLQFPSSKYGISLSPIFATVPGLREWLCWMRPLVALQVQNRGF